MIDRAFATSVWYTYVNWNSCWNSHRGKSKMLLQVLFFIIPQVDLLRGQNIQLYMKFIANNHDTVIEV